MSEPVWRASALCDLDDIVSYVFARNPIAAAVLDQAIRARARRAARFPYAARQGRVEGTREAVVRRNYVLVYRFVDAADGVLVEVLRVVHARQRYP